MTLKLKVGDVVTWTSKGRGAKAKKKGTIVKRVKAGKVPKLTKALQKARPMYVGKGRHTDSFLVLVPQKGHKGKELTPLLYWPRPEYLKAQHGRRQTQK